MLLCMEIRGHRVGLDRWRRDHQRRTRGGKRGVRQKVREEVGRKFLG